MSVAPHIAYPCDGPVPWVAASELQPRQGLQDQSPIDEVEEMSMESFPCSDPPCHRCPKPPHAQAD